MQNILVINPNSSQATTTMMVDIAAEEAPAGVAVSGLTAQRAPLMIVNQQELDASALEVEAAWREVAADDWSGVIISAFGDPALEAVRRSTALPVVGICESSMLEAAQGGKRFAVATVTPDLADAINGKARDLGLAGLFTGIRLTEGDPRGLTADPQALEAALAQVVRRCIEDDGAEAVIIGGGPLGQVALQLAPQFGVPIIAPISAAVRRLVRLMEAAPTAELA
ncbi:MAG: aspartate/glutamate racemase family protein [Comamonas sp.]|jgi:Asp/Glu/hydantoin racemase|nr:aspartate/glutamate racemase family protein [Comamonas sp.]